MLEYDEEEMGIPVYFYSKHPKLPFCALPEWMRAIRSTGTANKLSDTETEGKDERIVDSPSRSSRNDFVEKIGNITREGDEEIICYREDGRTMCTKAYAVYPCSGRFSLSSAIRIPPPSIHQSTVSVDSTLERVSSSIQTLYCTTNTSLSAFCEDTKEDSTKHVHQCKLLLAESNGYPIESN